MEGVKLSVEIYLRSLSYGSNDWIEQILAHEANLSLQLL